MSPTTTLFTRCPLCHQGPVTAVNNRIYRCLVCGAEFTAAGGEQYELLRCDPARSASEQLSCVCRERVLTYCLLGRSLPKSDWEELAAGRETPEYRGYEELKRLLRSGVLPEEPKETAIVPLAPGEVVYHISCPVYTEDVQPGAGRRPRDEGTLMLTNRRLVYRRGEHLMETPLADITAVRDEPPGFAVLAGEGCHQSSFYPPALDPMADAVRAALKKQTK